MADNGSYADRFHARRRRLFGGLQQQVMPADTRQQQQDNGTHEFQVTGQMGQLPPACAAHPDAAGFGPDRRAWMRLATSAD